MDNTNTLNMVALYINSLIAFCALLAAVGSLLSARATKKAVEANLFSNFMGEYASAEMVAALRTLRNWKESHGEEWVEEWYDALINGDEQAHDVEKARRMVKYHFFRALDLYKNKYATRRFLRATCNVAGINILYNIVKPLGDKLITDSKQRELENKKYSELQKLCVEYAEGGFIDPVPALPAKTESHPSLPEAQSINDNPATRESVTSPDRP